MLVLVTGMTKRGLHPVMLKGKNTMKWQHDKALRRIRALIGEAPEIRVRHFSEEYMPGYLAGTAKVRDAGERVSPPLFLAKGDAVLVGTVNVYIAITNYDDYRIDQGRETESSHELALRFLHLYYSACDRVAERSRAQRVDFHGSRMHAVVLNQSGIDVTPESIADAFAFVQDFRAVAEKANQALASSELTARFRIGIDAGPCVAINNGTGLEQEPMFLGSAANHAAKLAEGNQPGIYLSDRVRALMALPQIRGHESYQSLDEGTFAQLAASGASAIGSRLGSRELSATAERFVGTWQSEIAATRTQDFSVPNFSFHYHKPPLSDIDFTVLTPSNSIRMGLISMLADLSGYTSFIDDAVASRDIAHAVRSLYVIRDEFQNVVERDFGGRKVRFIGDCIHALLAAGSATETSGSDSVVQSFLCAGGLRSSFEVCQAELTNLESLGLAIGFEYGLTPVSRIGIRGTRSVRLASSVASATSEKMQRECGDNGVKLGPNALDLLPSALKDLTSSSGAGSGVTYDDVATCLSLPKSHPLAPAASVYAQPQNRNERPVARAHSGKA